jgi:hypothetical protein
MRNRVIHGYDKIDNEIILWTIVRHLPTLKLEIDNLLDWITTGYNFSDPSSSVAVVFGGQPSAQTFFRLDPPIAAR